MMKVVYSEMDTPAGMSCRHELPATPDTPPQGRTSCAPVPAP